MAMQFQGVESPLVCWGCLARFGMPGYLVGWEALEEWPMDRLDMAVLGSGRGERCVAPIANGWFRERWLRDLLGLWVISFEWRLTKMWVSELGQKSHGICSISTLSLHGIGAQIAAVTTMLQPRPLLLEAHRQMLLPGR